MDALSEVLDAVRLTGAAFFTALVHAPWAVVSPEPHALARVLGLRSDCTTLVHLVVDGECYLRLADADTVRIEAGDVVILPRGNSHQMMSDTGVAPVPLERVLRSLDPDTLRVEWHGSVHGQTTRLVCAYLHCDETFNPLVESLPALIIAQPFKSRVRLVSASESGGGDLVTLAGRSSQRLARSFADMAGEAESERPGSRVMLARMAELMFIDVLRRCVDSEGIRDTGWLAAVRDRQVGRALGLMHARPDEKWTVARLGKESGVSRSALGDRFRTLIGEPPMQYLTCLRMQRAMQLLREPGQSIAEIAPRVGYDSAVAFHRAFKRTVGQTPAEWRRAQLSA